MSGPLKISRTIESFFLKSSCTTSTGHSPDKSDTLKEVGSSDAVTLDVLEKATLLGLDRAASQANVTESDKYDIGKAIKKTKRGEQLTDEERQTYLLERWVPKMRFEYTFSGKGSPKINRHFENL